MKTLFLLMLLIVASGFSAEHKQDAILGTWLTPKKDGKIEFYKANNRYYAKLIWYKTPEATDINNPDPALRNQPVLGLTLFKGFTFNSKKQQWVEGTVYDPESGRTYACDIWMDSNDPTKLKARGYVMGMTFLGRTETFARIR